VRHAFGKAGGDLGSDGAAAYLFEKAGSVLISSDHDEDLVLGVALDVGAEDVVVRVVARNEGSFKS